MRNRARRVSEIDECDVGRAGNNAIPAECRNGTRKLVEPVMKNREVVWREIPHDADVRLVQTEVHPACGDEVDRPELAGVDQPLDRRHRRAVQERVARHQDEVARHALLDQMPGLIG